MDLSSPLLSHPSPSYSFPSPPSLSKWVILMNRWVEENASLLRCCNTVNQSPPPSLTSCPLPIPSCSPHCPFLLCLNLLPHRTSSPTSFIIFCILNLPFNEKKRHLCNLPYEYHWLLSIFWRMWWTYYNQGLQRLIRPSKTEKICRNHSLKSYNSLAPKGTITHTPSNSCHVKHSVTYQGHVHVSAHQ